MLQAKIWLIKILNKITRSPWQTIYLWRCDQDKEWTIHLKQVPL